VDYGFKVVVGYPQDGPKVSPNDKSCWNKCHKKSKFLVEFERKRNTIACYKVVLHVNILHARDNLRHHYLRSYCVWNCDTGI